jgi:hypothetical protein
MSRDDEIISIFEDTLTVFERLLSRFALSEEEKQTFEENVFLWFDRFTRRPGNERVPVVRLQIPLLSGACRLARDLGSRKGIDMPALSGDPIDIARVLGLLHGPQEGTER